jgi:hypothetical protein
MHPKQMRETLIPVCPSLTYFMHGCHTALQPVELLGVSHSHLVAWIGSPSGSGDVFGALSTKKSSYELFFLRSAQRFFIISDSRFLPAGVRPPRFFLREVPAWAVATLRFAPTAVVSGASKAAMARSSRSLSLFNSATIERKSKVRSPKAPRPFVVGDFPF